MNVAWCDIDLKALAHNFAEIEKLASKNMPAQARIMPVIKADAYGHGMLKVAEALDQAGCKYFGVSNTEEGVMLRKAGFKQQILTFESTLPTDGEAIIAYDLTPTICSKVLALELSAYAEKQKKQVAIHIKVDTGMGRLGVDEEDVGSFVDFIQKSCPQLILEGIYTHFPLADSDREFTFAQMRRFRDIVFSLENKFITFKFVHAGNSMGLGDYKSELFNLARPGIMLYGLYPSETLKTKIKLKPVMSIKAKILFVKHIAKGRGISYGHTFKAKDDMTIAVLPIGYSNGYLRSLSNKAFVLISGVRCPLIGRVTMDQIIIDVTAVALSGKIPIIGEEAVIIGEQKKGVISADDVANWAGTISYEILCSLGSRLPKNY